MTTVWRGILYLVKEEALRILGEPGGEFMALIPVGWSPAVATPGPAKRPLAAVIRRLN